MVFCHNEKPRVLVLTAPVDPTADAVIQHLAAAGISFARFDAAQFPMEISLTAILDADGGWRACLGGICLVPPTMITSCPGDVAAFASAAGGSIVTKALYARIPRDTDGYPTGVLYTAEVSPHQYSDPGIAATSHLFQTKIKSSFDVRLAVVGDKVFAAEIRQESGTREVDWRKNHQNVCYQPCDVPAAVARGIRQLMCSLELAFGALDFAVDDAGSWWFYEINPNGQWFWIEQQTGLPISAALAELLGRRPCTG